MNIEALTHRVVIRFATRYTKKTLKVKSLCARCSRTGTDAKSFETLRDEAEKLKTRYENSMNQSRQDKKPYHGQSVPLFGRQRSTALQTLRITMTARQAQLKHEQERFNLGKELAQLVGAAAR